MGTAILSGLPISGGIGIGRICVLKQADICIKREKTKENQIEDEIIRLEVAIDKTLCEICDLSDELGNRLEKEGSLVFEAYKTILSDKYFIKEIKDLIVTHKIFAENAVDICITSYITAIENSDNDYAKQSIFDIRDLGTRIIRNIIGGKNVKQLLDEVNSKKIIAVKCLTPWLAAALGKKNVTGIFSEAGAAYLSHSAIILRGLGIPAVNGISYEDIIGYDNLLAVIDGEQGQLTIEPDKLEIARFKEESKNKTVYKKGLFKKKALPALTMDGHRVGVLANIGNVEECVDAVENDADGIGLVRTEILFINHREMPDEKEQYQKYSRIMKKMNSKPVVFRTVDASEDKIFSGFTSKMSLTKRSLRGIGYSLLEKAQFMTQIRSLVSASQLGDMGIMFPVVNTVDEIIEVKLLINKAISEIFLKREPDEKSPSISIGAVIESRQGIENIDGILNEVDFISIGTNDLLQQIMGMSRKDLINDDYKYLYPDFLGLIKYCIDKASNKNKPVTVCGEMAADPIAAILLIGMGVNYLSMHPAKISKIKDIIRKINFSDAKSALEKAINCDEADNTRTIVGELFSGIINK